MIVIGAGTGSDLGANSAKSELERINLFLTHTHFDHVCGIPFFQPAYVEKDRRCISIPSCKTTSLRDVLSKMMTPPLFPIDPCLFDLPLS